MLDQMQQRAQGPWPPGYKPPAPKVPGFAPYAPAGPGPPTGPGLLTTLSGDSAAFWELWGARITAGPYTASPFQLKLSCQPLCPSNPVTVEGRSQPQRWPFKSLPPARRER